MSAAESNLVLVTGASSFIGSHMVYELLRKGYTVRGSARGTKVATLRRIFGKYLNFEAVDIADVATSDLSEVLQGVSAVIHTAAPLPGRADPETAFKTAITGCHNVLRLSLAAGVQRFVQVGSMGSYDVKGPWGPNDWNGISKEDAIRSNDPTAVYLAQKKYSNQAVVDFAKEHPEMDVTILDPIFVVGPFAPRYEEFLDGPDSPAMASNNSVYGLLRPDHRQYPFAPGIVDVRDVARTHVLALESPPSSTLGDEAKRFVVHSPSFSSWRDAIELIARERPGLKDRLPLPEDAPDFHWVQEVPRQGLTDAVGFSEGDYTPWEKTILDTVDSLLMLEQRWS